MTLNNKLFPRGTRDTGGNGCLGTSQNDGITSHGITKEGGDSGRGEKKKKEQRQGEREKKRKGERERERWRQDNGGRGKAAFITEHGHDGQSNGHLVPSLLSVRFVLLPWRNPGPN